MTNSFGARLRAVRERKGIGLDAIAHSTKINKALFEGLERGDISKWPSGLFRRAFIRAYAQAVGLDPEPVVAEFLASHPDPAVEPRTSAARGVRMLTPSPRSSADPTPLRLTLADESVASRSASALSVDGWPRRAAAAAYDAAIVLALAAGASMVVGGFSAAFAVAMACYFVGGVLMLGTSLGGFLVGRRRTRAAGTASPEARPRVLTGQFTSYRATHTTREPSDIQSVQAAGFGARKR
jgi:transcriptional regulator with XRE-family HTH domain